MPRGRKVDLTSARHQRFIKRVDNTDKFMEAIKRGIERGNKIYTKPYDVALSVLTELRIDGFQIIPRPSKKGDK
jgi:hypothetical protein